MKIDTMEIDLFLSGWVFDRLTFRPGWFIGGPAKRGFFRPGEFLTGVVFIRTPARPVA